MSSISWLHCNKCACYKPQPFFLTKCGHILCKLCGQRATQPQACPVCKTPITNLMPLDSKTPSDIANSFKEDVFAQIPKALAFQNKQNDAYLEHLKDKCNNAEEAYRRLRKDYDDEKKAGAKLDKLLQELQVAQRNNSRAPGFGGIMDITRADTIGSGRNSMNFLRHGEILAGRQPQMPDTREKSLYSMMRESDERRSLRSDSSTGAIPKVVKRKRF